MSENKLLKRWEVDESLTWDLTRLYAVADDFEKELKTFIPKSEDIQQKFEGQLDSPQTILYCLEEYESLLQKVSKAGTYSFLASSVDETDEKNQQRVAKAQMIFSKVMGNLSFIESELKEAPEEILKEAMAQTKNYRVVLQDILRSKPFKLHREVEKTLAYLDPVLEAPYQIYNQAKLADLSFPNFIVEGQEYPMSFVRFENEYQMEPDTKIRRGAFQCFSKELRKYRNTMASTYYTKLQQEKVLSDLRGHQNIFEYLLFDQKVERNLYDRQIDLIMEELAPHMRRYAKLLQKEHELEKITFADLKISLDPEYDPQVTIEESKEYIKGALSILGEDYLNLVMRSYDERWVDFAQNEGKSTGGFCAGVYGYNPYILLSWSGLMNEVFTLVHELGHAGHSMLSAENVSLLEQDPSMYFVEAPSTINELFLTNYLVKKSNDPRFKRWVLSSMIANTYYHNFVTHLLEATYQREVYKLTDQGESVHANTLDKLKKQALQDFWGDSVELNDGAELTWMRQPHYYDGLYSYTYSAGLTVATAVNQRILKEGESAVKDWLQVMKSGGTQDPVGLAKLTGVDITTEKPLKDTIAYIGSMIDEIERLTEEIHEK
ncbi:oligoendopeptidase F [Isachenkonia alkalipeptolytica]|uniref:Oligopeptidase F n=1 Tax=Isachenkonia alkalipeptolytica TaxID=2565777 RepID=A0AA44BER2_9CLOT|nr:oligoendopeptidase F [Isachenkonia alkalipeptolytica]NBG88455.1 oligoendopeptidase F [Isachenkonia alkalipeptolytica]